MLHRLKGPEESAAKFLHNEDTGGSKRSVPVVQNVLDHYLHVYDMTWIIHQRCQAFVSKQVMQARSENSPPSAPIKIS